MAAAIRRCIANDLPSAARLITELYRDRPQDAHLDGLPNRLSDFSLIAEENGEIVGLLLAERRSTRDLSTEIGRDAFPDDDSYLEIQELFVHETQQGKGIGSALVQEVLKRAKAAGIHRSMVYSANADYVRTARFYENCGFRMWHIFMTQ
jgi:ribosomal protein S18 acetylase RimI-like enzyme